jgi:hypothetical protein
MSLARPKALARRGRHWVAVLRLLLAVAIGLLFWYKECRFWAALI